MELYFIALANATKRNDLRMKNLSLRTPKNTKREELKILLSRSANSTQNTLGKGNPEADVKIA